MKKKSPQKVDSTQVLIQIQEQLAVLNNKFDDFINKSLTDLAQTLAIQKAAAAPRPVPPPQPTVVRSPEQSRRPMYAFVCFECGKDSELPFKPSPGRPVFCKECFAKRKAGNVSNVSNEPKLPPVQTEVVKAPEPVTKAKKKVAAVKKTVTKKKPVAKKKKK